MAFYLYAVGVSETEFDQVIKSTENKKPVIICAYFGIRNHIADKCMSYGSSLKPPTMCHRFFNKMLHMDQLQKWN